MTGEHTGKVRMSDKTGDPQFDHSPPAVIWHCPKRHRLLRAFCLRTGWHLLGDEFETPAVERVMIQSQAQKASSPAFKAVIADVVSRMDAQTNVASIESPLQPLNANLVSADGHTALAGRYKDAPLLGIADAFDQRWLRDATTYVIAVAASVTLVAAANSAMLGLSRLAY